MNLGDKIDGIVDFIFDRFGKIKDFPVKSRLLIHDNVHGTLEFTSYERKIINSPFLQRLTQIHQLGLASLVYPGGVHNRFSHSLGVSHVSKRILKVLKNKVGLSDNEYDLYLNTLKLAGLLHDIGHGPFSHVSEMVFSILTNFPDVKNLKIDKQIFDEPDKLGIAKNLHETLSYHLIKSKRFRKLLDDIYNGQKINLDLVPLCITGNKMPYCDNNGKYGKELNKKETLLVKIINGFSDADKIDYILRDSMFTGIPLPIEFDRLLPFYTIIRPNNYFELGVSERGARAFHLLLQSKSKMFPTVYRHHTTLSFESLLRFGIIDAIRNVNDYIDDIDTDKWKPLYSAIDLLYYTDGSLLEYMRIIDNPISNDVVKRINNRMHYKRVVHLIHWELYKRLIKSKMKYIDEISKTSKGEELNDLCNKKFDEYCNLRDSLYDEYKRERERKIFLWYEFKFSQFQYLLNFKKDIISKLNWDYVKKKLPAEIRELEKETLIDYMINIQITRKFETHPYREPYILRKDTFSGEEKLFNLDEMGFVEPKEKEHQEVIIYVLPELLTVLRQPIIQCVKAFFGEEYFKDWK